MRKLRTRKAPQDTDGGLGPRIEPRYSDLTPGSPLPPGASEEVPTSPAHTIRGPGVALLRKHQSKTQGWAFSIWPQVLLLCREQAPWTTCPGSCSALLSVSPLAKEPALGPAAHPRKESHGSICAWRLPLPGGRCHVLPMLSSSTADIITTGS